MLGFIRDFLTQEMHFWNPNAWHVKVYRWYLANGGYRPDVLDRCSYDLVVYFKAPWMWFWSSGAWLAAAFLAGMGYAVYAFIAHTAVSVSALLLSLKFGGLLAAVLGLLFFALWVAYDSGSPHALTLKRWFLTFLGPPAGAAGRALRPIGQRLEGKGPSGDEVAGTIAVIVGLFLIGGFLAAVGMKAYEHAFWSMIGLSTFAFVITTIILGALTWAYLRKNRPMAHSALVNFLDSASETVQLLLRLPGSVKRKAGLCPRYVFHFPMPGENANA